MEKVERATGRPVRWSGKPVAVWALKSEPARIDQITRSEFADDQFARDERQSLTRNRRADDQRIETEAYIVARLRRLRW